MAVTGVGGGNNRVWPVCTRGEVAVTAISQLTLSCRGSKWREKKRKKTYLAGTKHSRKAMAVAGQKSEGT